LVMNIDWKNYTAEFRGKNRGVILVGRYRLSNSYVLSSSYDAIPSNEIAVHRLFIGFLDHLFAFDRIFGAPSFPLFFPFSFRR
jgi:hypothetical protein